MAQWFFSQGGQQKGPVEQQELQRMIAAGQVGPNDLVWREGMGQWQPAAGVAELGAAPGYAAAPAAPYAAPPQSFPAQPYPGQPYPGQPLAYAAADNPYAKKAMTAFVLSLVGLVCFGLILGIVAIVMSLQAQGGMKQTGNFKNKGFATAALVIGVLDVIAWVFIMVARFAH